MTGLFKTTKIDVQKTSSGWTFTKTGKKGQQTVYEVTDTNGNGRYDKGDTAKLVKSDAGLFSNKDMTKAMKGTYECEGNEYSYDEMYGIAQATDNYKKNSSTPTYSNFNFNLGSFGMNPYWSFSMNNFMNPMNNFLNPMTMMSQMSIMPQMSMMPDLSQMFAQFQQLMSQYQPLKTDDESVKKYIQQTTHQKFDTQMKNYIKEFDDGKAPISQGNFEKLKEIYETVKDDPTKFTDELINRSAEILTAEKVPIEFAEKLKRFYVDTAKKDEQRVKSAKANANLIKSLNRALKGYESATTQEAKNKVLTDNNYNEIKEILEEFENNSVMSKETVEEHTQRLIKLVKAGPKDPDEE